MRLIYITLLIQHLTIFVPWNSDSLSQVFIMQNFSSLSSCVHHAVICECVLITIICVSEVL